jgi:hypothetical protein
VHPRPGKCPIFVRDVLSPWYRRPLLRRCGQGRVCSRAEPGPPWASPEALWRMVLAPSFPAVAGRVWTVPLGVRGTASLAPCPPPGRRLLWSPWLGGCLWFRHWLSNGAALCGVWLVGSGACPVTDAIALENVWNSPLVGRGAPPVPRGLSFAVVRSGGRPCCAVFVWFHTTHSRTPSPWAHRAGSAPSPEECPSARRAPLSGAPALPLHTVPPVSSCVLPVLWCLLLLWEALFLLLGSAVILCHFVLGGPC